MAAKKRVEEVPVEETTVATPVATLNYADLDEDTRALLLEAEEAALELEKAAKQASRRSLVVLISHWKLAQKSGINLQEVIKKIREAGLMDGSLDLDIMNEDSLVTLVEAIDGIVEQLVGPVKAKQIREDLEEDGLRLVMVFMEMMQLAEVVKA